MSKKSQGLALLLAFTFLSRSSAGSDAKTPSPPSATVENARDESGLLWKEPTDIRSRNLFYGPGGERDQPHPPFTFVEEDLKGTSPKYVVRDSDGVKWTVKLGIEARPETVATRLVWAAGYFTNEDYFLQDLQVNGIAAAHLKRGENLIGPGGSMHAARLKRHLKNEKKIEDWKWRDEPFAGSRELNGLKVMMALINNWDLKDDNNGLYAGNEAAGHVYMVSDLGASFGTTGLSFPFSHSKGDLNSFAHSKFIGKVSTEYVDFRTPSRPAVIYAFWPPLFLGRLRLDGLCHRIPRADARWVGHLLSGLSPNQIRDAFRAAGYTPEQVDGFSKVIEERITELNQL